MLLLSILFFLILERSYGQTVDDLCKDKQFLPFTHPQNRSVNYNQTTTLSDRFIREGWYGTLDFIIPSYQPDRRHCGTEYPIYLQGPPRSEKVIEDVTACALDCSPKNTITIKAVFCSNRLTVYRLIRPSGSNEAYCLDGIETVLSDFNTTVTLVTNLRNVNEDQQEYIFDCSFPDPNRNSLMYKSTWFVDDVIVYDSPFTDYNDADKNRSLTDSRLRDSNITTVGFQLHCDVRAALVTDAEQKSSLPSTSSKKFIGMIVENPVINMKETDEIIIRVKSVVPIGCSKIGGCKLTVAADIPKEDNDCGPTPNARGSCGISKPASQWNSWQQLNITSTVAQSYANRVTQKKIFLLTDFSYKNQPIWENYFLEPITINIATNTTLIEHKWCVMKNDPYLTDFESLSSIYFDRDGTFYMFLRDQLEVQVQITKCSNSIDIIEGDGYCVCGVVVRVGRTAFMINRCNLGYWFIDYILCDDGGNNLNVRKRDENELEIYLPSDTKIQISLRDLSLYNWLNIDIYPSVRDIGKTSGLCGTVTDKPPNFEYNNTDYDSWRVEENDNLFNADNWKNLSKFEPVEEFQHCRCVGKQGEVDKELDCTPDKLANNCSLDKDYKLFHKKRCVSPLRKKRSLPRGSQPHIIHHRRLKRDVSWKNGWTMNSASEYCTGLFNNSMVIKRCEGIRGINIPGAIETCVSDIQLSGTDAFALSSISSVSSQCLREASMNGTLREDKVENGKTILEMVKEVACPGECSDQGLCEDGKCICNSGYIGSDCSVSVNEPPVAHNLEADGHCDLLEDDCTEVAVFGGRFVDADQTKCKLLPFEIKDDKVTIRDESEIQTAVFESIGEVTCKLPARRRRRRSVDVPVIDETVTGYKVSVSNNGQTYSQQLNFIMYNTECMNCSTDNSGEMVCLSSPDHCIMNNICYSNGVVYNTGESEYVCRADSSGKSWLPVTDGNSKDNGDEIDIVVIGISVAVVVVVVITIIIVCLVRKRAISNKLSDVSPSATNPANGSTDRNHTIYDTTSLSKDNTHVYETFK